MAGGNGKKRKKKSKGKRKKGNPHYWEEDIQKMVIKLYNRRDPDFNRR